MLFLFLPHLHGSFKRRLMGTVVFGWLKITRETLGNEELLLPQRHVPSVFSSAGSSR